MEICIGPATPKGRCKMRDILALGLDQRSKARMSIRELMCNL
jgi:hypothetical protein